MSKLTVVDPLKTLLSGIANKYFLMSVMKIFFDFLKMIFKTKKKKKREKLE